MISIQNGSFILPPPDSNEEDTTNNNPHDRRNSARSLTTTQSQSELPDDALSHRASISTADDSPQSWDGDSPDYDEVKVHSQLASLPNSLSQNPPQPVSAAAAPPPPPPPCTAKPFAFGLFAAQHHPGSHHHHYNHHPDMDVIPKIEELDEDDDLENNIPNNNALQSEQQQQQQQQHRHPPGAPVHVPRKRGRPRKHPLPVAGGGQVKITKGRSKTGCITCRRRKKKCDETKPAYVNPPLLLCIFVYYISIQADHSSPRTGAKTARRMPSSVRGILPRKSGRVGNKSWKMVGSCRFTRKKNK